MFWRNGAFVFCIIYLSKPEKILFLQSLLNKHMNENEEENIQTHRSLLIVLRRTFVCAAGGAIDPVCGQWHSMVVNDHVDTNKKPEMALGV